MFAGYIVFVKITLNKSFHVTAGVAIINKVIPFHLLYQQRYNGSFLSFSLVLKSFQNPKIIHLMLTTISSMMKKRLKEHHRVEIPTHGKRERSVN